MDTLVEPLLLLHLLSLLLQPVRCFSLHSHGAGSFKEDGAKAESVCVCLTLSVTCKKLVNKELERGLGG